ncbi:response regulator [Mucilaginibacter aquariorum]|uniref:Response regulator n=1 Tax=Mucilaginibacter aquariorum TaxID=2967225 RepID=A0ABT1T3R9_9SPHI|nr:response regulator [Mucilaginibacter aquariorum]
MKKKVLIIENDQDIRELVTYILEAEGFNTMSTREPENLEQILLFGPNLILIDEFINNKPGHRLCHKIKQVSGLRDIPVIVLSTANDIELIATECQANGYIRKPFDGREIVDKVIGLVNDQSLSY